MPEPVKSADRTLAILELLTEFPDGLTLTEIQQKLALPKSSTYTLLTTMEGRGFLEQEPDSRRFRVGIRLWQAGKSYVAVADLEEVALPFMEGLRDEVNETVQLATLDGTDNVYVGKVDADQQLRLASRVGVRLPAYATAIGKAMLSLLTDDDIATMYEGAEFVPFTPFTITSVEALLDAVRMARTNGYAIDNAEYTPGVFCVAAPIRRPRGARPAAMSISVPEARKTTALIDRATTSLQQATGQLSARLGYQER